MLRAAARLGSRLPLERVQMAEVAAEADVALGTLYRYYPSKHHLFAGLLLTRITELAPPTTTRCGRRGRAARGRLPRAARPTAVGRR